MKKNDNNFKDNRTLAVNANSKELLEQLGIWNELKFKPQPINKIVIKDYINNQKNYCSLIKLKVWEVLYSIRSYYKILIKKLKTLKLFKNKY